MTHIFNPKIRRFKSVRFDKKLEIGPFDRNIRYKTRKIEISTSLQGFNRLSFYGIRNYLITSRQRMSDTHSIEVIKRIVAETSNFLFRFR